MFLSCPEDCIKKAFGAGLGPHSLKEQLKKSKTNTYLDKERWENTVKVLNHQNSPLKIT